MRKVLILTILFTLSISTSAFSKEKFDTNNPSVQLLKTLTEDGRVVREADLPVEKADVEADTSRVKLLKRAYTDSLFIQKNPIEEQSGVFE